MGLVSRSRDLYFGCREGDRFGLKFFVSEIHICRILPKIGSRYRTEVLDEFKVLGETLKKEMSVEISD